MPNPESIKSVLERDLGRPVYYLPFTQTYMTPDGNIWEVYHEGRLEIGEYIIVHLDSGESVALVQALN